MKSHCMSHNHGLLKKITVSTPGAGDVSVPAGENRAIKQTMHSSIAMVSSAADLHFHFLSGPAQSSAACGFTEMFAHMDV